MAQFNIIAVLGWLVCTLLFAQQGTVAADIENGFTPLKSQRSLPALASAQSAIVIDRNSGRVIGEKNADVKRQMASTTKMMTGLIVVERIEQGALYLDSIVTVSRNAGLMGDPK